MAVHGVELVLAIESQHFDPFFAPDVTESEKHRAYQDPNRWTLEEALDWSPKSPLRRLHEEMALAHCDLARAVLDPQAHLGRNGNGRKRVFLPSVLDKRGKARELNPFALNAVGDGDAPLTFGVSLITHQTPTWLDWAHEKGGADLPLRIDNDVVVKIDQARSALGATFEPLLQAEALVVQVLY